MEFHNVRRQTCTILNWEEIIRYKNPSARCFNGERDTNCGGKATGLVSFIRIRKEKSRRDAVERLVAGHDQPAIDRIGYYFSNPRLRNPEAGSPTDLSRETVAELYDSSSGEPAAHATFIVKATEALPRSCRCRRRIFISLNLRMKNDLQASPSFHP
jgi:hypothetical protein